VSFRAVQTGYLFDDGTNTVLLTWYQDSAEALDVEILLDGAIVKTVKVPPGEQQAPVDVAGEGSHLFQARVSGSVQGEATHEVRLEQPVGDAVNVTCEPGEEDCEVIIVFTNPGPPGGLYQVLLDGAAITTLPGDAGRRREVVRFSSGGEQCITLQSVLETEGGLYQGDPGQVCCDVACSPPSSRFVRGACDGSAEGLTISTAVFGLTYLFSGGKAPPCVKACDSNADGRFDLSDMVHVLGYLFLGTPPPVGWTDQDGDGKAEATCESAPAEECEASAPACAL